jgi:hypothetical protein
MHREKSKMSQKWLKLRRETTKDKVSWEKR